MFQSEAFDQRAFAISRLRRDQHHFADAGARFLKTSIQCVKLLLALK
jgi:hypothetical protein